MMRLLSVAVLLLFTPVAVAQLCPPAVTAEIDGTTYAGFGDADGSRMAIPFSAALFQPIGIRLIAITDRTSPSILADISVPGLTQTSSLEMNGDLVWVFPSFSNGRGFAVDITDPTQPIIGAAAGSGSSSNYDLDGDRLYVVSGGLGSELTIYDVSDPLLPVAITTFEHGQGATNVSVLANGDMLYAMQQGADSTLSVWDVGETAAPVLVSTAEFLGMELAFSRTSFIDGATAFTNRIDGGMVLLDIADHMNVTVISELPLARNGALVDEAVYAGSGNGMVVYDIADQSSPALVFRALFDASVGDLRVSGDGTMLFFSGSLFGSSMPVLVDLTCSVSPKLPLNVYLNVYGDTVIEPGDTEIYGVPLDRARIVLADPNVEVSPGFTLLPAPNLTLTINGSQAINTIDFTQGDRIEINGSPTISSLSVFNTPTVTVAGELRVDHLLLSGSNLTVDGPLFTISLDATDGAIVIANDEIITGTLSLTNGSTILDGSNTP